MHVAQQFHRRGHDTNAVGAHRRFDRVAMLQDVDLRRGRRDTFLQHLLPGEGVDERALAGVEFADHDEQEEFIELANRRGERRLIGIGRTETRQRIAQLGEKFAAAVQLPLQIGSEDAEHRVL